MRKDGPKIASELELAVSTFLSIQLSIYLHRLQPITKAFLEAAEQMGIPRKQYERLRVPS